MHISPVLKLTKILLSRLSCRLFWARLSGTLHHTSVSETSASVRGRLLKQVLRPNHSPRAGTAQSADTAGGFNMMELVQQLIAGAGVDQQQAEGGAGLLFGRVKEQLSSGDFSKVAEAVPGVESLIGAAPSGGGGLGGLLGGMASALGGKELGNLASLASGFSQLGLDAGMIGKFVPIVLGFLQNQGGEGLAALVGKVLQGD
ncbi:MAG: DUF2780 domain-containing protein [Candidatus Thiodiazotropha sp. (ex Dulcina madagascariensis)]|nr:DUF2780 domain-containing protein [Candidatus Thiodiazotropha sp. (ex Dulcina madagascariensis)]